MDQKLGMETFAWTHSVFFILNFLAMIQRLNWLWYENNRTEGNTIAQSSILGTLWSCWIVDQVWCQCECTRLRGMFDELIVVEYLSMVLTTWQPFVWMTPSLCAYWSIRRLAEQRNGHHCTMQLMCPTMVMKNAPEKCGYSVFCAKTELIPFWKTRYVP